MLVMDGEGLAKRLVFGCFPVLQDHDDGLVGRWREPAEKGGDGFEGGPRCADPDHDGVVGRV